MKIRQPNSRSTSGTGIGFAGKAKRKSDPLFESYSMDTRQVHDMPRVKKGGVFCDLQYQSKDGNMRQVWRKMAESLLDSPHGARIESTNLPSETEQEPTELLSEPSLDALPPNSALTPRRDVLKIGLLGVFFGSFLNVGSSPTENSSLHPKLVKIMKYLKQELSWGASDYSLTGAQSKQIDRAQAEMTSFVKAGVDDPVKFEQLVERATEAFDLLAQVRLQTFVSGSWSDEIFQYLKNLEASETDLVLKTKVRNEPCETLTIDVTPIIPRSYVFIIHCTTGTENGILEE